MENSKIVATESATKYPYSAPILWHKNARPELRPKIVPPPWGSVILFTMRAWDDAHAFRHPG